MCLSDIKLYIFHQNGTWQMSGFLPLALKSDKIIIDSSTTNNNLPTEPSLGAGEGASGEPLKTRNSSVTRLSDNTEGLGNLLWMQGTICNLLRCSPILSGVVSRGFRTPALVHRKRYKNISHAEASRFDSPCLPLCTDTEAGEQEVDSCLGC